MYLHQPPEIPQRVNVLHSRFEEIFADKERYKRVERPMWAISYYEFDIVDTTTDTIVGYCTETSYENKHQVDFDLCSKEDLVYHYARELKYKEMELWRSRNPRKHVPHDPTKPGLFEFLEDKYVHPYEPNLKDEMPVFEYVDDTEEPYHIPLVDEEE